jgi:hypothetical protein
MSVNIDNIGAYAFVYVQPYCKKDQEDEPFNLKKISNHFGNG